MSNIDLLTKEECTQIAIEEFKNGPVQSIAHVAALKLAEIAINTNAGIVELKTEATFNDTRYAVVMQVKYKKLKN